jgi:hypothetical protein
MLGLRTPGELAQQAYKSLALGNPDAVDRFRAAIAAAPGNLTLRLGEAEARVMAGTPEPLAPLIAAVASRPDFVAGHAMLAALRWEQGHGGRFADSYKAALRAFPNNADIWNSYISTLAGVSDFNGAADAARDARRLFDVPMLRLIEASHAGMAGDLNRSAALLQSLPENMPERLPVQARHLLRTGKPEAAAKLLESWRVSAPDDISSWALTEITWRLLGDPRAEWLSGQPDLVAAVGLPLGAEDLAELANTLRAIHQMRSAPLGQSVRGGTQTRGRLFDRSNPPISGLRDLLQSALDQFVARLSVDPKHPLLRHCDRKLKVDGGWSVRLTGQGFHVPHLHPAGVVSSACYIVTPPLNPLVEDGWLEIGRPPADLLLDLNPLKTVQPRPGTVVLFPSYLYHGTRPFAAGERLTVAFDAS